ncbi:glycosyltransferase family 4 protein [bacterium]|nr:glycosyltransferase family 4 protein [bacterium]
MLPEAKRLLVILPSFDVGGAEKFLLDLFAQLGGRGWSITAVSDRPSPDRWLGEFEKLADVHRMDGRVAPADQPRFIRDLIRERRPDVVLVTQSRLGFLLLPWLRLTCPGPAYADYCHIEEMAWGGGGFPRMAAELDALIDLHMVTSEHLNRWMAGRGASPERTKICTVNIDPNEWKPDPQTRRRVRQEHGIADDEPVVLFAGRLAPQKQPRVLAGALRDCIGRGLPLRAWIAGDGEDRDQLEKLLGRETAVEMLGMVGSGDIRELLAASDIFFLPSRWEGIALSIFEAMAMEVAVLGADVGGQRELVTPDCGILIARSDEAAEIREYAGRLAWLVGHPDVRRAMARRGRERVERHFTLDQMGARIDGLLRGLPAGARKFSSNADPLVAERCAACAVKAVAENPTLDFWRGDLGEDVVRADPTGIAAAFRDYWQRMTALRLEAMPSWHVYERMARWACRDWAGLSVADRAARFESSLLRRAAKRFRK